MKGKVKFFNKLKGFGFIEGDDGRDVFVHITAIEQGTYLQDGDRVSFDVVEDEKGLKAQNVKKISAEEPAEESGEEQPEEASDEEAPVEEEKPEESEEPAEEEQPEEESEEEKEE